MNSLHNRNRVIATLMIITMTILLLSSISAVTAEEKAGDVIFFDDFESSNSLQQNGDAVFTLTKDFAASGTGSLSVAPTADNNYSGVALRNSSLEIPMRPGGKYKLTAKAFSEKDATLGVRVETKDSSGGDTYGNVGSTKPTLVAGEWAVVVMEFSVPADHQSVSAIVFHNDDMIPELNFYLDDVKLEVLTPPGPIEQKTGEVIFLIDFESSNSLQQNGDAVIALTKDFAASGTGSLSVAPTADNNYSGVAVLNNDLEAPMMPGGEYRLTAKALSEKDVTLGVRVETKDIGGRDTYGSVGSTKPRLAAGKWTNISMIFTVPADHQSVVSIVFHNDDMIQGLKFYLDDVKLEVLTPPEPQLGEKILPEWDLRLPSITSTYKDLFDIGNIMSANEITNDDTTAMFKHHYSVVTAENDMKPMYLSPQKGRYVFTNADTLINWAESNNIKVHGHTLVWHSQSAAWLTSGADNKPLTRDEARQNMKEYIDNVAGHFKGKVVSWDVVNEAFDGGSTIPTDWKTVLRKNSPWYIAYENGADKSKDESGADYIYDAFVFARLADPGAILSYNDYNENEPWKREAMALMAEDLNAKWKTDPRNTQPDRMLVEVLGMQAHYWVGDLDVDTVEAAIERFAKAGVKIFVTELDIPGGTYFNQKTSALTKDEETLQAQLYAKLFNIYKKHADVIERVTFWGKADSQSWRANGSPVLFDKAFSAKPSYYSVVDPDGYLLTSSWKNPFSDVEESDSFYSDIAYACARELITGSGPSTFSPNSNVTWSQFLSILFRLDGQTGVTTGRLWNAASDKWAVENGLAAEGFVPGDPLSRQDMAVIIARYLEYSNNSLPKSEDEHTYADDASIAAEAKPAADMLYDAGIITGKTDNLFDPTGYTNRLEIAAIVHRLAEAIKASK